MQKNVGGYDRIARLVLGPILVIAALAIYLGTLTVTGLLGAALIVVGLLVGVVFVVTGAIQFCPLNRALGLDTYRGGADDETTTETEAGRPS